MKLSQIPYNQVDNLSIKQKTEIVFDKNSGTCEKADFAILLGGSYDIMLPRATVAAKVFLENKAEYIIVTGGVFRDTEYGRVTEALYMAKKLVEMGVPKKNIIIENEAKTTKENFICSALCIQRQKGLDKTKNILIVSSPSHIRRSIYLAKWLLPKSINIYGTYSAETDQYPHNWYETLQNTYTVENEARLLRRLIDEKIIDEIEFSD